MIRHSLLYFIVRAGNGLLAIAVIAVFTRLLSPEAYGRYILALAVVSFVSSVLFQWLNVAVGRFYPGRQETPGLILPAVSRAYWQMVALVGGLFLLAVLLGGHFSLSPAEAALLALLVAAQGRYDLSLRLVNAQGRPLAYGLLAWVKTLGVLLFGSLLVVSGFAENGALLGVLLGLCCVAIVSRLLQPAAGGGDPSRRVSVSELYRYGLPLSFGFLAIVIVNVSDRFLIGWFLGAAPITPYAATYDLVQLSLGAIMNVLLLAAFPTIVKTLEQDGEAEARSHLQQLVLAYCGLGLVAAVGLATLAPDVVNAVLGEQARQGAVAIVPVLAAAIFIAGFKSYYLDLAFQLSHKVKLQSLIAVAMAIVNLALNLLLLPRYGIIGAAWATLLAFLSGALASWFLGRRFFSLPLPKQDLPLILIAIVVMVGILQLVPDLAGWLGLLVKVCIGAAAYLLCSLLLNTGNCRTWLRKQMPGRRKADGP